MDEKTIQILFDKGLKLFPLHTILNGNCSCGNLECSSAGKHPIMKTSWKTLGTNKIEEVRYWKNKYKNINLGALTGEKDEKTGKYLIVIDVDILNHSILDSLPKTFTIKTGSGFHLWFWSNKEIGNSVSKLSKSVDVRGKNGYVVVPPSIHKSGLIYEIVSLEQIADLPQQYVDELTDKNIISKSKNTNKINNSQNHYFDGMSVPDIRISLNMGSLIPVGTRNFTCFRLLCSDRAKGVLTLEELISNAKYYSEFFEEKNSFDNLELEKLAKSVMKYPAYNTCFENVNELYFKWYKKNNKNPLKIEYKEDSIKFDNAFFSSLKKIENHKDGISLSELSIEREYFFVKKGVKYFPKYKLQLLAKKLESLGFTKKKTEKGNVWLVAIDFNEEVNKLESFTTRTTREFTEMTKKRVSKKAPHKHEDNFETIKVDVKRTSHPNDWKYVGKAGAEHKMAMTEYLEKLTPEQLDAEEGSFIFDQTKLNTFLDEVKVNDVLGVNYGKYLVLEKTELGLDCKEHITDDEKKKYHISDEEIEKLRNQKLSNSDIDYGLSTGFAEILYRDNKPYGQSETQEVKIVLPKKEYADKLRKEAKNKTKATK